MALAENLNKHFHSQDLVCPTCEQAVSEELWEAIRARLEQQNRSQAEEIEALVNERVSVVNHSADVRVAEMERQAAAQVKQVTDEAAARIRKGEEAIDTRIATAREEAAAVARAERHAELELLKAELALAAGELAEMRTDRDVVIRKEVGEVRDAMAADKDLALREREAEHFKERQKWDAKISDLQRQVQHKTADELGEGAEVNLFEALKAEFPDDNIRRVKKGREGADIVHEVFDVGVMCGKIVYDSKNRNQWRNDWVDKLRRDQLAEGAEHSVLTTHKFPAGHAQLCGRDGVVIVNPARGVEIARILRDAVVQLSALRLSGVEREAKVAQVYDYITSEQFRQRMRRVERISDDLLNIDVDERADHEKLWEKRGSKIKQLQKAHADVSVELSRILTAHAEDEAEAEATG